MTFLPTVSSVNPHPYFKLDLALAFSPPHLNLHFLKDLLYL